MIGKATPSVTEMPWGSVEPGAVVRAAGHLYAKCSSGAGLQLALALEPACASDRGEPGSKRYFAVDAVVEPVDLAIYFHSGRFDFLTGDPSGA